MSERRKRMGLPSGALLVLANEIGNQFYHAQNGKGGDVRHCPRFCSNCEQTKRIVDWIKSKAHRIKQLEANGR